MSKVFSTNIQMVNKHFPCFSHFFQFVLKTWLKTLKTLLIYQVFSTFSTVFSTFFPDIPYSQKLGGKCEKLNRKRAKNV